MQIQGMKLVIEQKRLTSIKTTCTLQGPSPLLSDSCLCLGTSAYGYTRLSSTRVRMIQMMPVLLVLFELDVVYAWLLKLHAKECLRFGCLR